MFFSVPVFPLADALMGVTAPQVAILIAGAAGIYSIQRWRRNTVKKQETTSPGQAAYPNVTAPQNPLSMREINAEVTALLSDVEETTRRLTAQIDNRYRRLELLIAEADEKIARLEALANQTGPSDSALATSMPRPKPAAPVRPESPRRAEPTARPAASAALSAAPAPDAQRVLARLREERGAPPASQDPAYQPIYSLADGGKSPREIAQQLGRQPGEVELILALRGR